MRLYTFTHFILSSIQQGIQSGHVSQRLVNNHIEDRKTSKPLKALKQWLSAPTIICLNGGNSAELKKIRDTLDDLTPQLGLPYTAFFEDAETLEGIMTSVGVVVPARIYEAAALMRFRPEGYEQMLPQDLLPEEIDLADLLNKYQLAK